MGFLDALTADAFPLDSQGRRVLTPYGPRGKAFILPPERVAPLAQLQRRFFLTFVVPEDEFQIVAEPFRADHVDRGV